MIILSYIMLGISLAAPIGPVNAAQIEKGLRAGFLHSWVVGIGAMFADLLYMLIVFLGVSHFLEIEGVKVFLWLFGAFVLIYTGAESLKKAANEVSGARASGYNQTLTQSFWSGFLISVVNPLTILFWLGIYGSVLAKTVTLYDVNQIWLFSAAIFIGITAWDIAVAILSSTARRFVNQKAISRVSILSGICLIGFGAYFGYMGVSTLFID
ncbi:LysE family transporter [Alkalicoccobacillus gibsonii]|uniref:LysE family transporter n=1 Tax=Alkalicoccobacillus gibsonii TaxID=79881 RepID=A0ABU9VMX4_9BACI